MHLGKRKNLVVASAFGFATVLAGCLDGQAPTSPANATGTVSDNLASYERETIELKHKPGVDQEDALRKLQLKYGVSPVTLLPNNPLDPQIAASMQIKSPTSTSPSKPMTLGKVASTIASGMYNVQAVYMEVVWMDAGSTIERYTSNLSTGCDPVAVLWRYTNQVSDFQSTGRIDPTAQHMDEVYSWNDDYTGVNPKISYTSASAGYYAFMVFAYANNTTGTATLTKRYKPAGGNWTQTSQNISVTGNIVRYYGAYNSPAWMAATDVNVTGSDPWAFFWDFSNNRGGDNDDHSSADRGSWVSNGAWFPASASDYYLNCMVFTGYITRGTAQYSYYN